jgi:hypothetical protein
LPILPRSPVALIGGWVGAPGGAGGAWRRRDCPAAGLRDGPFDRRENEVEFAWGLFWKVGAWTLVAYAIIAGMLMFVFIYDNIPVEQLTLLLLTLAVFALDIPIMLAVSVARFQPPDCAAS